MLSSGDTYEILAWHTPVLYLGMNGIPIGYYLGKKDEFYQVSLSEAGPQRVSSPLLRVIGRRLSMRFLSCWKLLCIEWCYA